MLWSSLPASELPAPGDRVVLSHDWQPWAVQQRIKDQWGQVHLLITRGEQQQWERVECLSWYPTPGDVCTLILRPYIEWVQAAIDWQRLLRDEEPMRYQAIDQELERLKKDMGLVNETGSWIYQDLHLLALEHNWATVQANGKGPQHKLPAQAIGVIRRAAAVAQQQQLKVAA